MTNQELRQKALELAEIHHSKTLAPVPTVVIVDTAEIFFDFLLGDEEEKDE